jgi:hypothetical protein
MSGLNTYVERVFYETRSRSVYPYITEGCFRDHKTETWRQRVRVLTAKTARENGHCNIAVRSYTTRRGAEAGE